MPSEKPQIIKLGKRARRKEWGRLDLDERDVKSKECERVFSKSCAAVSCRQTDRTRQVREL